MKENFEEGKIDFMNDFEVSKYYFNQDFKVNFNEFQLF